jgi:hypothetical protein
MPFMQRSRFIGPLLFFASARAWAGTVTVSPSDDTFINSRNPSNNNGGSGSIFTGTDGHGGLMRGLIRFEMPTGLQGRAVLTAVQLHVTVQALGNSAAGEPAVESLQVVNEAWTQGNGVGNVSSAFTVGQLCADSVVGATWTQSNCATNASWTTPGGTVAAGVSGHASNVDIPAGGQVIWDSASNAGMVVDVQSWIDSPSGNHGWRITSDAEGPAPGEAQRFYSTESGVSAPSLTITFTCRAGFRDSGAGCTAGSPPVPAGGPSTRTLLALLLGALGLLALNDRLRRRRRPL